MSNELINKIQNINFELNNAKLRLTQLKSDVIKAEDKVINLKLHKERLEEELRMYNNSLVKVEESERSIDIERFRKVLLLQKEEEEKLK